MKKIKYLFILILGLTVLSCANEEKDLFGKSAGERINDAIADYTDVLTSAPNGWVLYYYPQKGQAYGGFNILFKFDRNGSATVATELGASDQTETSLYELIASKGPVLTFNTFNSLLHYFSDPAVTTHGGQGNGLQGDYEFVFMDVTPQQIILKGIKTGNTMIMRPMAADTEWKDYLNDLKAFKLKINNFLYGYYSLQVDGAEVLPLTEGNYPVLTYLPLGETNPYNTSKVAFIYSPTGISLYQPLEFNGTSVQEFTWNEQRSLFISNDDPNVTFVGKYRDGFIHYNYFIGTWKFFTKIQNGDAGTYTEYIEYPVTITEKVRNSSYTITGLAHPFTVNYSRSNSTLYFKPGETVVANYSHSGGLWPVKILASPTSGSLYGTSTFGLVTKQDATNPDKFTWADDGSHGSLRGFGMYIVWVNASNATAYTSRGAYYDSYMEKQP